MRKFKTMTAMALVGASVLMAPPVVQAAPINGSGFAGAKAGTDNAAPLVDVRYRGRRYYRRGYYRGHHYHHNNGGAVAAGAIIGLAAGAIAANAAAGGNAVSYCSQRFRSYDPASGTYLGYDGYRHSCP